MYMCTNVGSCPLHTGVVDLLLKCNGVVGFPLYICAI